MFLKRFRIEGKSMEPKFSKGQIVLTIPFFRKPRVGDVVVLKHPKYPEIKLLKEIADVENGKYLVKGYNEKSRDSNEFGPVDKNKIIGKVIWPSN